MHLYKTFHQNRYFLWCIASMVLHHHFSYGPLDKSSTLSVEVAERMIEKFKVDALVELSLTPLAAEALMEMHIHVLSRHLAQWTKLLAIYRFKGYPPKELERWSWNEDHEIYSLALQRCGNTEELMEYLQNLFLLHNEISLLHQIVDVFEDKAVEYMDSLRDTHPGFVVALGNLYFAQKNPKLAEQRKELIEKDLEMLITYGLGKLDFYPDAVEHLRNLDLETQNKLLQSMENLVKTGADVVRDVNYELSTRELMGKHWSLEQRISQANRCYEKYLRLKNKEEVAIGLEEHVPDQYTFVAATILISEQYKLNEKEKDLCQALESLELETEQGDHQQQQHSFGNRDELLITAICVLQQCFENSPTNTTARFILANAYASLGATREMLKLLHETEIKEVQFDSLGYLLFPFVQSSGLYSDATLMLRQADNMYRSFQNNMVEYVIAAYENFLFCKAAEFRAFHERLLQSTQCGLVLVGVALTNFFVLNNEVENLKVFAGVVERDLNLELMQDINTYDNRDLTMLQDIFDERVDWDKFRTITANVDNHWFRTRLCLLTVITKLVNGLGLEDEEKKGKQMEYLEKSLEIWEICCKEWPEMIEEKGIEMPYYGIYPPLHSKHFQLNCAGYLLEQSKIVVKILQEKEHERVMEGLNEFQECLLRQQTELVGVVEKNVEDFQTKPEIKMVKDILLDFHWVLEFLAFSKILLFVAVSKGKGKQTAAPEQGKGKKEKKGKAAKTSVILDGVKMGFEKFAKTLLQFKENLANDGVNMAGWVEKEKVIEKGLGDGMETEALKKALESSYDKVHGLIRESYGYQLGDMCVIADGLVSFLALIDN